MMNVGDPEVGEGLRSLAYERERESNVAWWYGSRKSSIDRRREDGANFIRLSNMCFHR
jgi:hypothetical protein